MNWSEITFVVLTGLSIFFVLRFMLFQLLSRHLQRQFSQQEYNQLLTAPRFRVKGKYE